MQYTAMQSLFDSLCQCLGQTPPVPREGELLDGTDAYGQRYRRHHQRRNSDPTAGTRAYAEENAVLDEGARHGSRSPATRRASRLALKDKQWDALFDSVQGGPNNKLFSHQHGGSPTSSPESSPASRRRRNSSTKVEGAASASSAPNSSGGPHLETPAHVLAQAKQAANPSRYSMSSSSGPQSSPNNVTPSTVQQQQQQQRSTSFIFKLQQRDSTPSKSKERSQKRKRRPTRDDIFRSKKTAPSRRPSCEDAPTNTSCMNPISKFLSNHQGFANALCFATPVRDSAEEEDVFNHNPNNNDNQSLASDANTLNTCEDSMMLLDQKLARMSKNQPPMPLFHQFKVNPNESEGLRKIVATDSHSSFKLMKLWKNQHNSNLSPGQQDPPGSSGVGGVTSTTTSTSGSSGGGGGSGSGRRDAPVRIPPQQEELLPAMKKASSSSSDTCPSTPSTNSGRSYPHCGEI